MAYSLVQLQAYFKNANAGIDPTAAQNQGLLAIVNANAAGGSDAVALQATLDLASDITTSVGVQTYQFFLGFAPSAEGLGALNKAYVAGGAQANLNGENRYIAQSVALALQNSTAKAAFGAAYGALSVADATTQAYNVIVGSAAASAAGINIANAVAFLTSASSIAYYTAFVKANVPGLAAADVDLAVKAALVGEIIYQATIFNNGAGVGSYATVTNNLIKDLSDDGILTFNNVAGIDLFGSYGVKQTPQTFVLTDKADATNGGSGDDIFIGTNTTVSAADVLQGGSGVDALQYSSSGNVAVNQAGFKSAGIEVFAITSDAVGGTTFDVSGSTDVNSLINDNSSSDLTLTGLNAVTAVTVRNTSTPTGATTNTTINYTAAAVAGATTTQALALENVFNPTTGAAGAATSSVTANGVEIFNVTGAGAGASHIATLASNTLTTVNIDGAQGVQIDTLTFATNGAGTLTGTINGSKNTGGINVTIANSGAADTTVTGGTGNDRADFSNGFDAKDSFDGGTGTDTLVLNNATAIGAVAGKVTSVEVLEVSGGGTGTIDLSKFAGVNSVVYTSTGIGTGNSLVGPTVINKATSTSTVTIDAGTVGSTLTVATGTGTDTAADTTTININKVGAADLTGTITVTDIETVNLTVADDTTVAGTGVLTVAAVTAAKATKVTLASNADVTVTGATGGAALTSFDASASTGKVTLTGGLTTALSGATVKLGAGDDTVTIAATAGTATGGDNITLGAGKDTVIYTALAQSGDKTTDTITDFVSGTDKLDLTALGLNSSALFLGSRASFGLAQGALTGGSTFPGQAVFQADMNTLWIDIDGNGQLDSNDFRVVLSGVTSLTNADLGLGTGATVNLTGTPATVNLTTKTNASASTTNEADTITSSFTNLAGSTINGGLGTDTLTVSGESLTLNSLIAATATGAALTSVENITFSQVTGVMSLTNQIGTDVKSITLSSANAGLTATTTATKQSFTVSNTSGANGSTITVANTGATVTLGAANDTVLATAASYVGGVFNAGTGTDVLSLDGGTYDLSKASATTASIAGFETITLTGAGASNLTLAPDANVQINQNAAALTVASTGNTVNIAGSAAQAVTVSGSSNFVVSGSTTGAITSTATGTLSVTASANAQTVTSTSATTINAAALTAVETVAGNGAYTITGLGTVGGGTIAESGARTGALTITTAGTFGGTVTESAGTGAVVINHAGTGTLGVTTDIAHGVTTINSTAAAGTATVNVGGTGTVSYTATGAGAHVIVSTTSGAAADTIVASAAGADSITAGAGADKITISGGNDHLILATPASDTGIAVGFTASTVVPANLQQINVAGMDVVNGFSSGADLQLTGLTTSTAIIRNGGTLGAATVGDTALLTGDYNSATGIFTVNTAGVSTLFVYDDNGTAGGGNYRGVVLVGYTDTGATDTVSAGGLFVGVA
jgi:S-layer protein